jgi:NAD+ kinase
MRYNNANMANQLPIPQRIAIAAHVNLPQGLEKGKEIAKFLEEHGKVKVAYGVLQDHAWIQRIEAGEFDLLIALGGDGTMLRAGSIGAPLGLPILGINFGRFGFLAEIQQDQYPELLPLLLDGRYRLEERMLLRAEHFRYGNALNSWIVVNEAIVCRGQFVRPIQIEAEVDGYRLASYIADGLIAATPTGSTAYTLAVGGPIMPPDLHNIMIIPVAPHLSVDRAIILSEGTGVTMTVHTTHEAVMSIDGRAPIPMLDGDSVRVTVNESTLHFVRFQDPGYFYRNLTAYMEQNPLTGNRQ